MGKALHHGMNWTFSLALPSIHHYLPHLIDFPQSLEPAFKLAPSPREKVSLVMGIPTVKRTHQSYLSVTLKSVFENMVREKSDIPTPKDLLMKLLLLQTPEENPECLIIVFVAETDLDFVKAVADEVDKQFPEHVQSGLVEVVGPSPDFYPDFSLLRQTLGDDPERVQWRSKQNLDYAFLMMYAQTRGIFYVQLEDDILTKPGFTSIMKNYALETSLAKKSWMVIDFCQLGFIGKLFKTVNLPYFIEFFIMFYNDKPVDWLLEDVLATKMCKLDYNIKTCKKAKDTIRPRYKPSLFQHIGTHSSLKGKVQKLKDKGFGRVVMFVPHHNPPAIISTVIKHYKAYSINRAYLGETFYWGLVPQAGDNIVFSLTPPVTLTGFKFVSGNAEHPSDKFISTTIEIAIQGGNDKIPSSLARTDDGYVVLGSFDEQGVAQGKIEPDWGEVAFLRFSIHASSENWVILSEMHLMTS